MQVYISDQSMWTTQQKSYWTYFNVLLTLTGEDEEEDDGDVDEEELKIAKVTEDLVSMTNIRGQKWTEGGL